MKNQFQCDIYRHLLMDFTCVFIIIFILLYIVCLYEIQLWKYTIPLNYKYLGNYLFESPSEKIRVSGLT